MRTVAVTAGVVSVSVVFIVAVAVVILFYIYCWKPKQKLREQEDAMFSDNELLPREDLECDFTDELRSDAFSCVYSGSISRIRGERERKRVSVKKLRSDVGLNVKRDFNREAKISLIKCRRSKCRPYDARLPSRRTISNDHGVLR